MQRIVCSQARVDMQALRTGRLPHRELPKLALAAGPLSESKLFIDDSADCSVLDMRSKARRLKSQHGLDMIIVDYLQLIKGPDNKQSSREQEISYISRSLKMLAKELDIPVLALSQLSRKSESRENKRPMLSDLRESGAIEQDADVVLFVYRDIVYNTEAEPGSAEIIIGKQRNGPIGNVPVTFIGKYAAFENASKMEQPEEIKF